MIPYKEQQKHKELKYYTHSRSPEETRQEEKQMNTEEQVTADAVEELVSWDEAIDSGKYIRLEQDKEKRLVITNWRLVKVKKFEKEEVEFIADVLKEDGKECTPIMKVFSTTSNRLKAKLRPLLENIEPASKIELAIIKIGDKFDTQYSVRKITGAE